jgi:hypothetical protein
MIVRRHLLHLAAAALAGCGGQSPPPATQTTATAAVETPATAAVDVLGDPALPVAGRVFGAAIHTQDAEELRYFVLKSLTDRYAASNAITVTQEEKEAYVAQEREVLSKDPAVAPAPREESAEDQAAHLEIAEAFIMQWKINRALYRQYGGRIIFQQGGPEPLDAYRKFLEQRQAAGDFSIDNEALADEFWRYFKDNSIHSFYKPGSQEEAQAFATAPWTPSP